MFYLAKNLAKPTAHGTRVTFRFVREHVCFAVFAVEGSIVYAKGHGLHRGLSRLFVCDRAVLVQDNNPIHGLFDARTERGLRSL